MDFKLTMDDLPIECMEEILKRITGCLNSNSARLVCKLWCTLINRSSFSDCCYVVNDDHIHKTKNEDKIKIICEDEGHFEFDIICFDKLVPQFLGFQRKNVSYYFNDTDFQNSKQFWKESGSQIKHLSIDGYSLNIPFTQIYKNCHQLKTLKLSDGWTNVHEQFINSLKNRIRKAKSYSNCHSLFLRNVTTEEVFTILNLFNQVLPQVQNVHFEDVFDDMINWPERLYSMCAFLINLNFSKKIVVSYDCGEYTFVLDQSAAGNHEPMVKATSFSIWCTDAELNKDNFLLNFLPYSCCNFNCLENLYLYLNDFPCGQYELDYVAGIMLQLPLLKLLQISLLETDNEKRFEKTILLRHPLSRPNIQFLQLNNHFPAKHYDLCIINNTFLQSFRPLKSFKCGKLLHSDFLKLLRHLDQLEVLSVRDGVFDGDHDVTVSISNNGLTKLLMPNVFLFQGKTMYEFGNLRELSSNTGYSVSIKLLSILPNVLDHLKRLNCKNILTLNLLFNNDTRNIDQDDYSSLTSDIFSHFPTLKDLKLDVHGNKLEN